jgi:thymidylate kinase
VSDQPLFESLEGLRGVGKSTVAPLLAEARGAILVPTIPAPYHQLRRLVDQQECPDTRMCLYLSGLFAATRQIRRHLAEGVGVVVESYFARCLATHQSMGATLGVALPDDLPQPTTYRLTCSEDVRRRRLARRRKPPTRWDLLAEAVVDRTEDSYAAFAMQPVDTTERTPPQVVEAILALTPSRSPA